MRCATVEEFNQGSCRAAQDFKYQLKKPFLHHIAAPCTNSSGNVYLTPTYDSACNLAISGASCGVNELYLSGRDRLLHQTVHIRGANTATAVLSAPQNVSAWAPMQLVHNTLDYKMWKSYVVLLEHSFLTDADKKYRVSNGACHCGGPQAIARFGANLTSDDCTPQSVRKDTRPSAKPCLSVGSTAVPDGPAISFHGQTSFLAIAVKKCFAFDKSCKWPK